MKITDKQFNKLKQLDRIEYRQRVVEIKKKYDISYIFHLLGFGLVLVLIMNTFLLSIANLNLEFARQLDPFFTIMDISFFFAGVFYFAVGIIMSILEYKKTIDLQKEYFNFKVETKK